MLLMLYTSEQILTHFRESLFVHGSIVSDAALLSSTIKVSLICTNAYKSGKKILIAGNGGSAADAQHLAGELVSRFYFDRPALAAIALTTDTSILTAIGNDYGYADIFSRQIQANGQSGDVFIAISTSGNSLNIIKAMHEAKALGMTVIGLSGQTGGAMKSLCDICFCIPSNSTPRIQEGHLLIEHSLCACIEEELFGQQRSK
jgi:D-sedoheptulose 7-phosphate isomerase